jgi:hypothetical protein
MAQPALNPNATNMAAQIAAAITLNLATNLTGDPVSVVANDVANAIVAAVANQTTVQVTQLVASQLANQVAFQIATQINGEPVTSVAAAAAAVANETLASLILAQLPNLIAAQVANLVAAAAAKQIADTITMSVGNQIGALVATQIIALGAPSLPAPAVPGPLVVEQTPGTLRNNWTGPVGFQFTASVNATVISLGRWVVAGNSQPHIVALCTTAGDVLAYVTVNTSGASPGSYAYAGLDDGFALIAGTTYVLVSQESYNGDQWFDDDTEIVLGSESSSAATPFYASGTLSSAATGWTTAGGEGVSYGPVNLLYTVP